MLNAYINHTLHCTTSDNAHSKRYVYFDHVTTNVVINSEYVILIKSIFVLNYFICIAYSPNMKWTKPTIMES